jgi:VWFA-related protein
MPVRARTNAVLPWSMWPAVPIMMFFISTLFILAPLYAQSSDAPLFKAGVADVRVDVLVTENKNLVKGLAKDDFVVTDEGQPQTLVSFSNGDEPLNLILLLDISGSMQKHIELISETARDALAHLRPADRVAIMVFAKTSEVHQDFSDNLAETARQIARAVQDHDVGNTTQINAAVVDAAHYMQAHAGPGGSRAILILTDNLSMSYQLTDGQVIRELNKADTVFNAIVTGHAIEPNPPTPRMFPNPDLTPANVMHLSDDTGGEWVKAERADQSFNAMIERIRSRYMLAYHEPAASPGAFRHVGVALTEAARKKYPLAELRARTGYYAE